MTDDQIRQIGSDPTQLFVKLKAKILETGAEIFVTWLI
jgi:hypothetical protein